MYKGLFDLTQATHAVPTWWWVGGRSVFAISIGAGHSAVRLLGAAQ